MFETPIGARGSADWAREAALAPATLPRPGYTAPRTMLWDGVHSRPDALSTGDLLCFVLRAYKAPTAQEADVAVYSVTALLGPNGGRAEWEDRRTRAVRLGLVGFVRHDRFRALLDRSASHHALQRTQRCTGAVAATVLANLDVDARV